MTRTTLAARSALPVALLSVLAWSLGCGERVTGPGRTLDLGRIRSAHLVDGQPIPFPAGDLRVTIRTSQGAIVADTTLVIAETASDIILSLRITTSEATLLASAQLSAGGVTLFEVEGVSVSLRPLTADPDSPPAEMSLDYVGPGATTGVDLRLTGVDSAGFHGDTLVFVAEVLDAGANVIAGVPVFWTVRDPLRAEVPAPFEARAVLGDARGNAVVLARTYSGLVDSIVLQAQRLPAHIVDLASVARTDTVASERTDFVHVRLIDADSVPVTGLGVAFATTAGGPALDVASALSDSAGEAAATVTLPNTAGAYSVTVTAARGNASAVLPIIATPAAPVALTLSGGPGALLGAGDAIPALQATVRDQFGNVVTAFSDSLYARVLDQSGTQLQDSLRVVAVNGVATFAPSPLTTMGPDRRIEISALGLPTAVSSLFTVRAGTATQLVIVQQPAGGAVAGDSLSAIILEAQDQYGNRDSTFSGEVTLALATDPSSTMLVGDTVRSLTSGGVTFNDVGVGLPGTGYTLQATAPGIAGIETNPIGIVPPTVPVATQALVTSLSAYCALSTGGSAYCWGSNSFGQLGTNDQLSRDVPTPVLGGLTFESIAGGNGHVCGLTTNGEAYCWGRNDRGQLGDGTTTTRPVPGLVSGGLTWRQLGLGTITTCGLTDAGEAYCWGIGERNGDGTATQRNTPFPVALPVAFTSIAVGGFSSCALTAGGHAFCWGVASWVGDGASVLRLSPTPIAPGERFTRIVIGGASGTQNPLGCGISAAGPTLCWGQNTFGEFADGNVSATNSLAPVPAWAGFSLRDLSLVGGRSCGITLGDAPFCTGRNLGAFGDGTFVNSSTPRSVSLLPAVSELVTSGSASCAIAVSGSAYCWGVPSAEGILGDGGTVSSRASPTQISALPSVADVAFSVGASTTFGCAVTTAGGALCWGVGGNGQRGDGTTDPLSNGATSVLGGHTFTAISTGLTHACGIASGGSTYCWGASTSQVLGTTTPVPAQPSLVQGGIALTRIASGQQHNCGLANDSTAYCWGAGSSGQLGGGSTVASSLIAAVNSPLRFVRITAGQFHSCALASGGAAHCWGSNGAGQLGVGTLPALRNAPTLVVDGHTFSEISAGSSHTCALTASTGAAYCWGTNISGILGIGSVGGSFPNPQVVTGGLSFVALAAGTGHTCGLTSAGAAYCWGLNAAGQLGDGTKVDRLSPTLVSGAPVFAKIRAGANSTCGITGSGDTWCWGSNANGAILVPVPLSPAPVVGGLTFRTP